MKLAVDPSIQSIPFYPKAALYGADDTWVRLSSNENPYGPSPKAVEALLEGLLDINRYPESEGELKTLIARKYGLQPGNVLIGNGSNEIIETTFRAMRTGGRKKILVPEPSFAFYRVGAAIYGFDVAEVRLPDLTMDLPLISARMDGNVRLVFLNNPNNPTGTIFGDGEFRSFLGSVPDDILVVVDEAYAEFSTNHTFPRSWEYVNDHPVVVLRTFSKAFGLAGLRIGYGLAEQSLVSYLERTKQPFSVNMMALVAARAALEDEAYLRTVLKNNEAGKSFFYHTLNDMGLSYFPTEANFILIRLGEAAGRIVSTLFERKILVRWMDAYGLPEYVRVTIGTMDENRALAAALKALLQ